VSAPIETAHGAIATPAFLPDATRGFVRGLAADDLERCGAPALVMSTFHVMQNPGSSVVRALGGVHGLAAWRGPILTDSGGFQIYSLVREQPKRGSIAERGITFQPEGAPRPFRLTAEKTVTLQVGFGADIVVCLDDCRHADDSEADHRISVERTIRWGREGRRAFDRIAPHERRPLLFAVIQGGASKALRQYCAEELLAIGFDGFGFGGWPLDAAGDLLVDTLAWTRELVPAPLPLHALGIGHPESIVRAAAMGYALFDSALPTRDARQGRLYHVQEGLEQVDLRQPGWFDRIYLRDEKQARARGPIDEGCSCPACARFSLAYLHHLFRNDDAQVARLATLHNLTFMARLTARLRLGR